MKIWIDLATGPQVLFVRPIVRELQKRGNSILITTREFTETVALANQYKLVHTLIGAHGGATMVGKGLAVARRAIELARFVKRCSVTLALGGSYSQALAVPLLHVPLVVYGDYEGNPGNHIICRIAKRILVPNAFHKQNLQKYGASLDKIVSYGGLKENVYLADFVPDPQFLEKACIPQDKIIATMRPPSDVSSYHRFKNPLFDELLLWASSHSNTVVVLLPRGAEQRRRYEAMDLRNVVIPRTVLDGPNLIYYSDLVIGAGGTINREAAVLGTPVYTAFKGEPSSVDEYLIGSGKMARVIDRTSFPDIKICKKRPTDRELWTQGAGLVREIVDKILS